MGERSHDRQLTEARTAYTAAVFRLLKAMDAFNGSAFPLDPGSGTDPLPWSRRHVAVAQALELLLARSAEQKALGSEVLHLYREINLIYSFSEKLAALPRCDTTLLP